MSPQPVGAGASDEGIKVPRAVLEAKLGEQHPQDEYGGVGSPPHLPKTGDSFSRCGLCLSETSAARLSSGSQRSHIMHEIRTDGGADERTDSVAASEQVDLNEYQTLRDEVRRLKREQSWLEALLRRAYARVDELDEQTVAQGGEV